MGWLWAGWIGPAAVQISGCCLGAALSWLCDGLLQGLVVFHWPFVSSWTVTLIFLGLGFPRARVLQLYCSAAFPICLANLFPLSLHLSKTTTFVLPVLLRSRPTPQVTRTGVTKNDSTGAKMQYVALVMIWLQRTQLTWFAPKRNTKEQLLYCYAASGQTWFLLFVCLWVFFCLHAFRANRASRTATFQKEKRVQQDLW